MTALRRALREYLALRRAVGFKPDAADMPAVDLHLLPIDISSLSKIASHVMTLR